jgi:hypothetical protein
MAATRAHGRSFAFLLIVASMGISVVTDAGQAPAAPPIGQQTEPGRGGGRGGRGQTPDINTVPDFTKRAPINAKYLCVLLAQEGSDRLSKETVGTELLSSVMLVLEARRNLVRLAREARIQSGQYKTCLERLEQDTALFLLRDLTLDLCQSTPMPAVATPRSLDLVHLRTALWFHDAEQIDRFVTMDASQEQAAKELGLPV